MTSDTRKPCGRDHCGQAPCGARTCDALLSVANMFQADALTIARGTPGIQLMRDAGAAVAHVILDRWPLRRVVVLCGPGNNGGDGFVVAKLLAEAGWPVRLGLLGEVSALKGDAALAAAEWEGPVFAAEPGLLDGDPLVVDALLGAGLLRPVEGMAARLVEAMAGKTVVSVDLPSGVHGDTGRVMGVAPQATLTVTFFRHKPGHWLLPGRDLCGEVVVADIGIPADVLTEINPAQFLNSPTLWRARLPRPARDGHKFHRGHAMVLGGDRMTGAARLAARAALRVGAGLVTIACSPIAFPIYAAGSPSVMVEPVNDDEAFLTLMRDERRNAALLGPGAGVGDRTRARVLAALDAEKACVLDADALTSFADTPDDLLDRLDDRCLLTPHEGEFARLFGTVVDKGADKLTRARAAANRSGAVVLLKGADTVIAAPDRHAVISVNGCPHLATAGSGDTLAGLALGLMAQGMTAFDAACAAAWMHGAAGTAFGPGLIAEDIPEGIPAVLRELLEPAKGGSAKIKGKVN